MTENKPSGKIRYSFSQPLVSVILPVYNGAHFLKEAIECILKQTHTDYELIIIDDGSTDASASIISAYADPRIRFYSQKNQGLAATLNRAISLAKGTYVARQDQDDVSLPDRLSKQVTFLNDHPDYGMVGTWALIWEDVKETQRSHKHPTENLSLQFDLLFNNPFVHSSIMIRKKVFDEVGAYCTDVDRQPPEDYELWSRVARKFKVANIPDVLHVYREVPQSMSRNGDNPFLKNLLKISVENLAWVTNGRYQYQSVEDLVALTHGVYSQFSGKTSLRELIVIVRDAARVLCSREDAPYGAIQEKVNARIINLSYRYYRASYSALLGYPGMDALKSILLILWKLIRKVRGIGGSVAVSSAASLLSVFLL